MNTVELPTQYRVERVETVPMEPARYRAAVAALAALIVAWHRDRDTDVTDVDHEKAA